MADLAAEERERFGVTPESRVSHFASPSFDASVFELMMAFGAGATLVIVAADDLRRHRTGRSAPSTSG